MLARQIDWIIAYANSLAFDIAKAVCEQSFVENESPMSEMLSEASQDQENYEDQAIKKLMQIVHIGLTLKRINPERLTMNRNHKKKDGIKQLNTVSPVDKKSKQSDNGSL